MRLIDADALLERMKRTNRYFNVKFDIDEAPTIDAVPVVHGRWEEKNMFTRYHWMHNCSACGNPVYDKTNLYNYCPSCGAKMDLEVDE